MGSEILRIAFGFIFFVLGLKLYQYGAAAMRLAALNFQEPSIKEISIDEEDELHAKVLELADSQMKELGFEYFFSYQKNENYIEDDTIHIGRFYFNPSEITYADVNIDADDSPPDTSYSVLFINYLSPEKSLYTYNFSLATTLPIGAERSCLNAFSDSLKGHWQFHLRRLEELKGDTKFHTFNSAEDYLQQIRADYSKDLQAMNLVETGNSFRRIPLWNAIKISLKFFRAVTVMASKTSKAKFTEDKPDGFVEAEIIRYQRYDCANKSVRPVFLHKLILTLSSMGLSTVAFGVLFSWSFVPALMIALFIHELGHLAAMKLSGYKDCQMVFMPPFGALAIGENENPKPWQMLFIFFMGPLPGILLVMLAFGGIPSITAFLFAQSFFSELFFVILFINIFNLLPISPLDGGRIFELLFLQRFPRIKQFFAGISSLALGGFGFLIKDYFLIAIAIFVGWSFLANLKKSNKVAKDNQRRGTENPLTQAIIDLSDLQTRKQLAGQRYQLIKSRLFSLKLKSPGWPSFLIGILLYLSVFALIVI
jgi:Zn-dependent protease